MKAFAIAALGAAMFLSCITAAFSATGRPGDFVAPPATNVIDRPDDDAHARYERVVDGAARAGGSPDVAEAAERKGTDSYAKYLMVVDGMNRDSAMEHAQPQMSPRRAVDSK
jgi:hypothetical protein